MPLPRLFLWSVAWCLHSSVIMGLGGDSGERTSLNCSLCPVPWRSLPDEETGTREGFPHPGAGVLAVEGMLE